LRRLVAVMKSCHDPKMLKAIRGMDAAAMRTQAGFDKVVESLHLNEICIHTTHHMDSKTMSEYRAGIASISSMGHKTLAETVLLAEGLAKNNGGMVPGVKWLGTNGYSGVRNAIRKYPEAFAHLKQERRLRTLPESVLLAEKLVKDNGGMLPSGSWLTANGYDHIIKTIRRWPEAFAHIKQAKQVRILAETVLLMEKLAKDNGGMLPTLTWFKNNGLLGLFNLHYKHPEAFAHIERERKKRGLDDEKARRGV